MWDNYGCDNQISYSTEHLILFIYLFSKYKSKWKEYILRMQIYFHQELMLHKCEAGKS